MLSLQTDKAFRSVPSLLDQFHRGGKRGLQVWGKDCKKQADARRYRSHNTQHKSLMSARRRKIKAENARKVFDYLSLHPCVECDCANPLLLDFDHLGDDKKNEASNLVHSVNGWEVIEREIKKCAVRFANCHRIVIARRSDNLRYRFFLEVNTLSL